MRLSNFRHSWACTYLDATGDIFGAAMMLGTSVKMLQTRYFHMDEGKLHQRYLAFVAGQQPFSSARKHRRPRRWRQATTPPNNGMTDCCFLG